MKNKRGFVLTETLVVTVFLVTISTFIYVSIIPLMGRYEDMIDREKDVDIVYKLYNVRKLLLNDTHLVNVTEGSFNGNIKCSDLEKSTYCSMLMGQLELNNYRLIYVDNIYNNLNNLKNIDTELHITDIYDYIKAYQDDEGEYLILLDANKHTVSHLLLAPFIQTY